MTMRARRLVLVLSSVLLSLGAYFTPVSGDGRRCQVCVDSCPASEYGLLLCFRGCGGGEPADDCPVACPEGVVLNCS
jgi:hypothetical protein